MSQMAQLLHHPCFCAYPISLSQPLELPTCLSVSWFPTTAAPGAGLGLSKVQIQKPSTLPLTTECPDICGAGLGLAGAGPGVEAAR